MNVEIWVESVEAYFYSLYVVGVFAKYRLHASLKLIMLTVISIGKRSFPGLIKIMSHSLQKLTNFTDEFYKL